MNARPDFALCPVSAKGCTHHAHCARAQLKPHATRQAWFTPNRRGDECQYFTPIEAYQSTPASSDAATERAPLAEAGGVQFHGAARSARAVGQQPTATATNATPRPAPSLSREPLGVAALGFGVDGRRRGDSAPAYPLTPYEREHLAAARRLRAA